MNKQPKFFRRVLKPSAVNVSRFVARFFEDGEGELFQCVSERVDFGFVHTANLLFGIGHARLSLTS